MGELVKFIAMNLVDKPDEVKVEEKQGDKATIIELTVSPDDMGKVIGKQGRIAKAIIQSMTARERRRPDILNASRRKRIARGSGTSIQEVNRLLNQFEATKKMMKQFTGGGRNRFKKGRRGGFPFGF